MQSFVGGYFLHVELVLDVHVLREILQVVSKPKSICMDVFKKRLHLLRASQLTHDALDFIVIKIEQQHEADEDHEEVTNLGVPGSQALIQL